MPRVLPSPAAPMTAPSSTSGFQSPIGLSRSRVVAMMRGVYCPLATWIATSSEPKVNTRKDKFAVMMVSSVVRAPLIDNPRKAVFRS